MQIKRVHIYDSVDAMMERLSQAVIRIAQESICRHGRFDMVLSGGNTPQKLYALLARQSADWLKWHIWFGDERCLAPEDSQRNSYMAAQIWLHRVAIPKVNLHVIPAELGREGAEVYAKLLSEVHEFDLTLLGLGEDGHTASLFPENAAFLKDSELTQFVANSPKPPSDRITMSAGRLSLSRQVIFLVSGKSKKKILASWLAGQNMPAAHIVPPEGVDIAVSMDAWGIEA